MAYNGMAEDFLKAYRRLGYYEDEALKFGTALVKPLKNESPESSKSAIQHKTSLFLPVVVI